MRKFFSGLFSSLIMLYPVAVWAMAKYEVSLWWILGLLFVVLALTSAMAEDKDALEYQAYPFAFAGIGILVAGYNVFKPTSGPYVYLVLCALFIQLCMFVLQGFKKKG